MASYKTRMRLLCDMLSYARPAGSDTDNAFRERFLMTLPGAYVDSCRNIHVEVGDGTSRALFSSHTDTATRSEGRQTVHLDNVGVLHLSRKSTRAGAVLGADDTAGIFVMCEMIRAGVSGHYIFHYGEEIGGIGSSEIAEDMPEWLRSRFDMAVAFDRRGYTDVITRQSGGDCCSSTFARALSDALNRYVGSGGIVFAFAPCDGGIFTDTANYIDDVPECTNLSVGYFREHSTHETLDTRFLFSLSDTLQRIDWASLPIARDPVAARAQRMADMIDLRRRWALAYSAQQNMRDALAVARAQVGPSYAFVDDAHDETLYEIDEDDEDDDTLDDEDNHCAYLDPQWEQIQRALRNAEIIERRQREADRIESAKRRQPSVLVGRF